MKTSEKSMKLKEANRQRTFIAAVKDLDFWLGEVESLLNTDDVGKDLASVLNLMKKHQLVDADIESHDDRTKDMNDQATSLIQSEQVNKFFSWQQRCPAHRILITVCQSAFKIKIDIIK